MGQNRRVFEETHPDFFPYYKSWCHDEPIIVSRDRDREFKRLVDIVYRCAEYYVHHYKDYLDIIDYPDDVMEILEYAERYPFRAGAYRPDYIIDEDGRVRLVEITSRFFGNGYFMGYFMEKVGEELAQAAGVTDRVSYYDEFFDYVTDMSKGYKCLLVLKSADRSDSIKLYVPFYKALGLETVILEADQVEDHLDLFEDSFIVSALNQVDMMSFQPETRHKMADYGMRNDFRTIFLLHDKRFFHLFFRDEFTGCCLNEEDTVFLREHAIETAIHGTNPEMWADAAANKDAYIIKHHCLGKSEKVYAGCLTSQEEWDSIFAGEELDDMILQPFISQRVYTGSFRGETVHEYMCPCLFTIDDKYFGTGVFRGSSCPVTNKKDDHKIAPIMTDQVERFQHYNLV